MGTCFTIGAFAVITDGEGRVLLCHRRDMDWWNLPGGGMEAGELPTEAVIREVREETGLEVAVEAMTGLYAKSYSSDLVFTFRCRVVGGELGPTEESSACAYFPPDALPANTMPKHVERLRDALSDVPKPCFRVQSSPPISPHAPRS